MELETDRLKLIPLKVQHLSLAVDNYREMATELGVRIINTILDDEMQYIGEK